MIGNFMVPGTGFARVAENRIDYEGQDGNTYSE